MSAPGEKNVGRNGVVVVGGGGRNSCVFFPGLPPANTPIEKTKQKGLILPITGITHTAPKEMIGPWCLRD